MIAVVVILVAAILAGLALWPSIPSYLNILLLNGNQTTPPVNEPPGVGNDTGNSTDPQPAVHATVTVLCTPSAFPFADRWVAQFKNENRDTKVEIAYSDEAETIPSRGLTGVTEFLSKSSADLVITGNVPEWNSTFDNGTAILPVAPQAVAIVYNVPGLPDLPSGLKLDPPTLSGILNENVSFWDDPRIMALNPGTVLPHERVRIIHSPAERSTSQLLEQYLLEANQTTTWWNTSIPVDNPNDVASEVRRTPYSVAYVEYSYAILTRMTYAAVQNHDGDFVIPTSDSIYRAIVNGTVVGDPGQLGNASSLQNSSSMPAPRVTMGRLGNGSYPLVGFYYAIFHSGHESKDLRIGGDNLNQTEAETTNSTRDKFIRWIASDKGQRILGDVGYPLVYDSRNELTLYRDRLFD